MGTTASTADLRLVQRLIRRDSSRGGFDGVFACDCMGAAEFEWGALPDSLKRIRKSRVVVQSHPVQRGDRVRDVFFVGSPKRIAAMVGGFEEWLADEYPRGKELTYFPEHFEDRADEWRAEVTAWWSLGDDVMWALDKDTAHALRDAIKSK